MRSMAHGCLCVLPKMNLLPGSWIDRWENQSFRGYSEAGAGVEEGGDSSTGRWVGNDWTPAVAHKNYAKRGQYSVATV